MRHQPPKMPESWTEFFVQLDLGKIDRARQLRVAVLDGIFRPTPHGCVREGKMDRVEPFGEGERGLTCQ